MKIFLINLPTAVDRKKTMSDQLNRLGLDFEILDAVYGKGITDEEAEKYFDMNFYNNRPSYYTAGSAGCALSHYFIYKKMLEENIATALILEDDLVLEDDLPSIINSVGSQIKDNEVIMLYYQSFNTIELKKTEVSDLDGQYQLFPLTNMNGLTCTGAYCITYAVAKRFVDNILPINTFADDWVKLQQKGCFDLIRMVYPFVVNNAYLPSSITQYQGKYKVLARLLEIVNRKKIFPFYQLLRWKRKQSYAKARRYKLVD